MSDERPFDPLLPDRAWTVCFYSYRGGVGRTTLAVNVARDFTYADGMGDHKVGRCLLLDFDLEAPGVDEFDCMRPSDPDQPGLVEYIREYLDRREDPPLERFVYAPQGDGGPFVMRAGRRDEAYRRFLMKLSWSEFYRECDGALFLDNLRLAVVRELGCQTLLIDSRTGHSEIGGVCLGHLADAVVFVFQPSTAHAEGLAQAVAAVRDREQKEERSIPRFYVANKVPEIIEDTIPEEIRATAEELVRRCEGQQTEFRNWGFGLTEAERQQRELEELHDRRYAPDVPADAHCSARSTEAGCVPLPFETL
ncbi:MAG: hypothetical protein AB1601_16765 [Planctomycetota bacterium]